MKQHIGAGLVPLAGMVLLILDPKTAAAGAAEGIELCIRTVIPSLFPFFVLSILMNHSMSGRFLKHFGRFFGMPPGSEMILVSAFLGGYPVGAQAVANAYRSGQLPKSAAQRLLGFCNNPGPAFLFGMTASLFPDKRTPWVIWSVLLFSAWLVSLPDRDESTANLSATNAIPISAALHRAISVMASVCGWVLLFRVVIAYLSRWVLWRLPAAAQVCIIGFLELTNGCAELNRLTDLRLRFLLCTAMLCFGGLCVTMQTMSVCQGLSSRGYRTGKGKQTGFAICLAAAIAYSNPLFALPVPLFLLFHWMKQKKTVAIRRKLLYNA